MKKAESIFAHAAIVGLTLISISAGFKFYHALFGLAAAVLCSVVFETVRLGCLWSLVTGRALARATATAGYIVVSSTCALVAVTNQHAEILASHTMAVRPYETAIQTQVDEIKRQQAQRLGGLIATLDDKIDVSNRKLAWAPDSRYWKNRLGQLQKERTSIVQERDSLLAESPKGDSERWLQRQAALLGVTLPPLPFRAQRSGAIISAIRQLWGMDELRAKMAVAIAIVSTAEFGILLIAFTLARRRLPMRSKRQRLIRRTSRNGDLRKLSGDFSPAQIESYRRKRDAIRGKYGREPYTRELSRKQREMRKVLEGTKEAEVASS